MIEIAHAIGDAEECCRLTKQVLDQDTSPGNASNYLMRLSYLPSVTKERLSEEHLRRVNECYTNTARRSVQSNSQKTAVDKLRIGYLSPDLVLHPVGFLFNPVLKSHDQTSFFTVLYDVHAGDYPVMEGLPQACSLWRSCRGMSDEELLDLIVADRIDILVDLAGHSRGGRLQLLAQRIAPIQISWLGYFHTTGLPNVDWLLADRYSIPDGEENLYAEKIWRLPHYRFPVVPKSSECTSQTGEKTESSACRFVSFNNLVKITPQVLEVWAEILCKLPEAALTVGWKTLISEEIKAGFRERFMVAGGNPRQLELLGPLEHEELLQRYRAADVMLDSFPFSGGMTSIDALSMGVPVVTLAGDRMAGRQTQAFLELSGHPELVAYSTEEYIKIAVDLANNPQRLRQLRETLQNDLLHSPLCDVKQFTRDLEAAYRGIWEEWCSGRGSTEKK